MERGYVPSPFDAGGIPNWFRGEPQAGWLGGLKAPLREVRIPIATFRCRACGCLEFYARPGSGPR